MGKLVVVSLNNSSLRGSGADGEMSKPKMKSHAKTSAQQKKKRISENVFGAFRAWAPPKKNKEKKKLPTSAGQQIFFSF